MSEKLSEKIIEARKRKGISQEELAELAGINIRTVQRIERGVSVPRGHTLRRLCEALSLEMDEVVADGVIVEEEEEEYNYKGYILFMYFSVWLGFVVPLANLLVPGIMWLAGRKFNGDVDLHGKAILKIQFIWSVFIVLGFVAFTATSHPTAVQVVMPSKMGGALPGIVIPATFGAGDFFTTLFGFLFIVLYVALFIFQLAYPLIANNLVNKGIPRFTFR